VPTVHISARQNYPGRNPRLRTTYRETNSERGFWGKNGKKWTFWPNFNLGDEQGKTAPTYVQVTKPLAEVVTIVSKESSEPPRPSKYKHASLHSPESAHARGAELRVASGKVWHRNAKLRHTRRFFRSTAAK